MKPLTLILGLTLACGGWTVAAGDYHVSGKIELGGEGGWDYLTADSDARRLYVSHGTKVVVVDLDSGRVAGEIPDTQGVHGIAITRSLNRGFTSNGRTNDVTIFDLTTLAPIGRVKTGENPDAIVFEPHSGRVFTFNGKSKDSTVIDAATGKVLATIPLTGKPEFPTVNGKGNVWVNIENTHQISEIDAASMKVTRVFTLVGCEDPTGMAIDAKAMRLFSVCGNGVMVISDAKAGKPMATAPIGRGADGAGFDPMTGSAFSSNGRDGTLTVVSTKGGKFEASTVTTVPGARTMAIDLKTHNIYLPTADSATASATFRLVIVSQ